MPKMVKNPLKQIEVAKDIIKTRNNLRKEGINNPISLMFEVDGPEASNTDKGLPIMQFTELLLDLNKILEEQKKD